VAVGSGSRQEAECRPLPTAHCPLPTAHCPLPTAHCPLPTAHCPLPTGRSGATLLEVLVAIFVMGIGLMSLLVLFPLGALSMARAIQDERAAQAAVAASAIANIKDIRRDAALFNPSTGLAYFYDPQNGNAIADLEKKSWPVLLDPVGFRTAAGLGSQNCPAGLPGLLRRTSASFVENAPPLLRSQMTYRWFTLQDDLVFDKAGNAQAVGAGIERDVRYSCAYLLQRPRTADPSVVDCSVIVYSGRPLGLSGNLDLAEYAYYNFNALVSEVKFEPSTNVVTVNYAAFGKTAPPLRAGDWILDVSIVNGEPHGYFYRVAGINDNGTAMEIETQQPLRGFTGIFGPTVASPLNSARLLFLEGVAEVFERGLGKSP